MEVAVFDLGTRASRLLIGNTKRLISDGFDFKNFRNEGALTYTGEGLVATGNGGYQIQLKKLEQTINFIQKNLKLCKRSRVQPWNIYAVGTEVFRLAENYQQVKDVIMASTGLELIILDPIEEAETTFIAATHSMADTIELDQPYLVIEQGGGSMQITMAKKSKDKLQKLAQVSIPELGTLLLKRKFMEYNADGSESSLIRVGTIRRDVYNYATETIKATLDQSFANNCLGEQPSRALALGSVITKVYNKSNRKVHNKSVRVDYMKSYKSKSDILERYEKYALKSLLKDAKNGATVEDYETISKTIEVVYGLACYAAVLDYFGLDQLSICGTGLRYGVFFRVAFESWKEIRTFDQLGCAS